MTDSTLYLAHLVHKKEDMHVIEKNKPIWKRTYQAESGLHD